MTVSAGGYVSLVFDNFADPNLDITYISLTATGVAGATIVNYTTLFDSISYQFSPNPEDYILQNATINFTISDSTNALESYGWAVWKEWNNTLVEIDNQSITNQPSGGTIGITITNETGTYRIFAVFKQSDEDEYSFAERTYVIYAYEGMTEVDFTIIGDKLYWLVAIIIAMLVSGFASRIMPGMAAGVLGLAVLVAFVALNPTLTIGGVNAWLILLLISILLIAVALLKTRT